MYDRESMTKYGRRIKGRTGFRFWRTTRGFGADGEAFASPYGSKRTSSNSSNRSNTSSNPSASDSSSRGQGTRYQAGHSQPTRVVPATNATARQSDTNRA
eukprot:605868-Pyramimonas_sp.AAC.1